MTTRAAPFLVYQNPTRRIFGDGVFGDLPEILRSFTPSRVLLVLGEQSFRRSPHYAKLEGFLAPFRVDHAGPVSRNPSQQVLEEEIQRLRPIPYDLVLAIGGGSVLDAAKLFAVFPKQEGLTLESFLSRSQDARPGVPLIAVPTTSGTGSEVTPYASLETPDRKKVTAGHRFFYPTLALVDPELTWSLPAYVTASTGFDALSQAMESFWSVNSTSFSQTHALRAMELIGRHFEKAFREPRDAESRRAMALASCEAGLAIAHTKTTAVHSVSYPITAHFGVAHGHACSLTLAEFVRFNAPVMRDAGVLMLAALQVSSFEALAHRVERLMDAVGLERSLGRLGIDDKGRELIVRDGFRPDRILNNPRKVESSDLIQILEAIR